MPEQKYFAATLVRSGAGRSERQRRTLLGLNLKRLRQTVVIADTPENRGMLYRVCHLVHLQPFVGVPPRSSRWRAALRKKRIDMASHQHGDV